MTEKVKVIRKKDIRKIISNVIHTYIISGEEK